jgi:hypothetical protein
VSKNLILVAAIGAAVMLVLSKQSQAAAGAPMTTAQKQAAGLLYTPPQTQSVNMNGDMWTRLLGDGWRNLAGAQNSDGSAAFLKKNIFGQVTTGDGKPVGGEDPGAGYFDVLAGLPSDSGKNYLASVSPYDNYIDTSGIPDLGW